MSHESSQSVAYSSDSAAVFACAMSLWNAIRERASAEKLNLSEACNGLDQCMREVMRVAAEFEAWACVHVSFDELNDVWPYLLESWFGEACLTIREVDDLASFDAMDCLRVAVLLGLPGSFAEESQDDLFDD